MIRPLSDLRPEEKGIVAKVGGHGAIRRRMLDMGVVVGCEVEVERVAPLGDPVAIKIKGYVLSLRNEEASRVQVEVGGRMTATEMALSMAATGRPLRVVRIDTGMKLSRRLADLGLTPGAHLQRVDASEAWSATGMLGGRGLGGFLGRWRHRGTGDPAPHAVPDGGSGGFRGRHPRGSDGAVVVDVRGSKYVLGYGVSGKIIVSEDREGAGPRLGK